MNGGGCCFFPSSEGLVFTAAACLFSSLRYRRLFVITLECFLLPLLLGVCVGGENFNFLCVLIMNPVITTMFITSANNFSSITIRQNN
jgi:hypothetical protein